MDRLKHKLAIAFLLINAILASAQQSQTTVNSINVSAIENVFVHLNTSTFITGETLFYKLYCINPKNNTPSSISKMGYIELIDSNKQSVFKNKVYLENGKGYGDFFIPSTLKNGNYKLIAYTKWMLNKNDSFFYEMDIKIINPFTANDLNNKVQDSLSMVKKDSLKTTNLPVINTYSNPAISLELDKKTYSSREKVNLNVKLKSKELEHGNYSVSVRKVEELLPKKQLNSEEFTKTQTNQLFSNTTSNNALLPELRGELLTGKIISTKGLQNLSNKPIALSIPGKSFVFKLVKTDYKGAFTFILDKNTNSSDAVIQVVDQNREDFKIILDDAFKANVSKLDFTSAFELNASDKNTIEKRSIAVQLENAYYTKKKDSIEKNTKPNILLGAVAKEYILDEYTRFPTLKETITEVIIESHSKRKNNVTSIYLTNDKTDLSFYGDPLVLVDGLFIQDPNEIFEYNVKNIYKVSLINQGYVYGPKTFGGVVSIETKTNDFQTKLQGDFIKKIDLETPVFGKMYYTPDYSTGDSLKRIPDYRYQLLWKPNSTLENNTNPISFYTSDVPGIFEIAIEGFTESGIPFSAKENFEVK